MSTLIKKVARPAAAAAPHFSILIPTWNNLAYLQLCIDSILKHSSFPHQIIVLINEGTDGTLQWVKQQKQIDYVHASQNIGICKGLNSCRSLVRADYLCYVNDDMYLLPDWDGALVRTIKKIGHPNFMLSATMIEPHDTKNACVIVKNYGDQLADFEEAKLLNEYQQLEKADWSGSTWPPNLLHRDLWDLVGGMSVEFSPGMYSDPDLSMKLWQAGVRYFKGVGDSKVYHFGSKSTKRVRRNKGKDQFLQKWGISSRFFCEKFLRRGQPFSGPLPEPIIHPIDRLLNRWKRRMKS